MPEERTTISFRIDAATRDKLDKVAKALDRDRSYILKEAVSAYVTTFDQQIARIDEGLAQAERGEFVSDEEMDRLFAKWSDAED